MYHFVQCLYHFIFILLWYWLYHCLDNIFMILHTCNKNSDIDKSSSRWCFKFEVSEDSICSISNVGTCNFERWNLSNDKKTLRNIIVEVQNNPFTILERTSGFLWNDESNWAFETGSFYMLHSPFCSSRIPFLIFFSVFLIYLWKEFTASFVDSQ